MASSPAVVSAAAAAIAVAVAIVVAMVAGVVSSRYADGMSKSLHTDVLIDSPAEGRVHYAGATTEAVASMRWARNGDNHISQSVQLRSDQERTMLTWGREKGRGGVLMCSSRR